MNRSISRVMWLTTLLCLARVGAAAQQAEVVDGLQLSIATGSNTENLTGTVSMLYLQVTVRNVSAQPVQMDFGQATYLFEYEFDGTWYAFEPLVPVQALVQVQTIAPGSQGGTYVTVPLAARSPVLQLRAITASGQGKRFEPTPGPHVVRMRPGRALSAIQPAPVSNAVTISFRTPARVDFSSQSVVFTPARNTALQELRFVSGPTDAQALIRELLVRPPNPASNPQLLTAAALQIIEPLPYYDLRLPRRLGAPDPSLPATSGLYHYIVSGGDQVLATIGLALNQGRSVLHWTGDAIASEPLFRALQKLAGMTQVRGGDYEPRLLRITGVYGTSPVLMLWLRSSSGKPDLFYRPQDPRFRGATKVESEKLYVLDALLQAARTLPVAPRRDEAWAVRATMECSKARQPEHGGVINPERAVVEISVNEKQDGIIWYVFIPELTPAGGRVARTIPQPGVGMLVDEADGSCTPAMRE